MDKGGWVCTQSNAADGDLLAGFRNSLSHLDFVSDQAELPSGPCAASPYHRSTVFPKTFSKVPFDPHTRLRQPARLRKPHPGVNLGEGDQKGPPKLVVQG